MNKVSIFNQPIAMGVTKKEREAGMISVFPVGFVMENIDRSHYLWVIKRKERIFKTY